MKEEEMAAQLVSFKKAQDMEKASQENWMRVSKTSSNDTKEEKEKRRLERRERRESEKQKQDNTLATDVVVGGASVVQIEEHKVPPTTFEQNQEVVAVEVAEEEKQIKVKKAKVVKVYAKEIQEKVNHMSFKLITTVANSQLYNLRTKSTVYHVKQADLRQKIEPSPEMIT